MGIIDIIILIIVSLIVLVISIYLVRKKMKGEYITCECKKITGKDLVKKYHKKYKKPCSNKCNCNNK